MNPDPGSNCSYKYKELGKLVLDSCKEVPIKFIALTETWLQPYHSDAQVPIDGFNVYRSDRKDRRGGGVLLYSHVNYPVSEVGRYDDSECEGLFVKFESLKLIIFVIYRPPGADGKNFKSCLSFMRDCLSEHVDDSYQVCLTGDLNFPFIEWKAEKILSGPSIHEQQSAQSFLHHLNDIFMCQLVMEPTRANNILDLFCANDPGFVSAVEVSPTFLSDHHLVSVLVEIPITDLDKSCPKRTVAEGFKSLDFYRADYESISQAIRIFDWEQLERQCTLEEYPEIFTATLFKICKKHTPAKRFGPGSGHSKRPRLVNALRRKKKRLLEKLQSIKTYVSSSVLGKFHDKWVDLNLQIKEAYMEDHRQKEKTAVEKIKTDPKYFFTYARSHSVARSDVAMLKDKAGILHTKPQEIANTFQDHFSSVYSDPNSADRQAPSFSIPQVAHQMTEAMLEFTVEDVEAAIGELKTNSAPGPDGVPAQLLKRCKQAISAPLASMWRRSLEAGVVPSFYKLSLVTPLHKKENKITPGNYRPVSLTSHIVKVFERVIKRKLVNYLEWNKFISPNQHGFRSGRSTLTQLLAHVNDVLVGWSKGLDLDCIYLDYAKAFDKVDHALLVQKLEYYSIHPKIVKWVESFLENRKQCVVVNGAKSKEKCVISGVPQGSVLGPVLFIIFINDLESVIQGSTMRFFADDTKISKRIASHEDHVILQEDLQSTLEWSKRNNMQLHEQKFELMVHKADPVKSHWRIEQIPFTASLYSYNVSSEILLWETGELKDLGVRLTSDLSWGTHIGSIVAKGKSCASWVLSVFKSRDTDTMLTLYNSFVRSQLEYCSLLWHPTLVGDIELVEGVQRTFTARISGMGHLNYWERLKSLNLMSLQRRRERYIIITMWKYLNKQIPNDINVEFRPISRRGMQAVVPSIPRCRSRVVTQFDSSFAVVGPNLWNKLPASLNEISNFDMFKGALTKFLLKLPDLPPVQGYPRTNNNSLVEILPRTNANFS